MPDTSMCGCDNGRVQPSPPLLEVLERARRLGVLGPGPVLDHVSHAEGFIAALEDLGEGSLLIDLGSGGGVPGLVIAEARPDLRVVLLDSLERRVALLAEAIVAMNWEGRVVTELARAEDTGRSPQWRAQADVVTARSFGPPATVAECAAPLLQINGVLVESEPPEETTAGPPMAWPRSDCLTKAPPCQECEGFDRSAFALTPIPAVWGFQRSGHCSSSHFSPACFT